jgi:hypothetical protein
MVQYTLGKSEVLTQQMEALALEQDRAEYHAQLRELAVTTTDDRGRLLKHFFLQEQEVGIDFLNFVESIAPQYDVELKTKTLDMLESDSFVTWGEVTFSISGFREELQTFVKVLENLPYVVRLTNLSFSNRTDGFWQGEVTLVVGIVAYENEK